MKVEKTDEKEILLVGPRWLNIVIATSKKNDIGEDTVFVGDCQDELHLNKEEVKDFIKHLQTWIDTGSFEVS